MKITFFGHLLQRFAYYLSILRRKLPEDADIKRKVVINAQKTVIFISFKISEINVTLSEFNGIKNVLIGGLGGAKFETFEG